MQLVKRSPHSPAASTASRMQKMAKGATGVNIFIHPLNEVKGGGIHRNHCLFVCPSVCLSVCLCMSFRHVTFSCFYIGLQYIAYRCITMGGCVAYIHDPNTVLTFDLKIKLIGFLHGFVFRPQLFCSLT